MAEVRALSNKQQRQLELLLKGVAELEADLARLKQTVGAQIRTRERLAHQLRKAAECLVAYSDGDLVDIAEGDDDES